ncbi:DUF1735 domain-containing protein [Porphyromonas levii]|uniref:DUF1735 domain-containing protein n=1 Tax=Porphyromonas levii TaxID=28114 RepID=UPI001B8AF350|nr:DUF1735 domain-containing protein [Porphyromonas levii]MBR8759877.1 hypothetical protein [Porphyromonas levii]
MKSIYKIVAYSIGAIFFASCARTEPVIVESDYSYTPTKPKKEDRSKITLPQVDVSNQYIYFKDNDQKRKFYVIVGDEGKEVKPLEDVTVKVSTAFPVKEAFVAELQLMTKEEYPKTYAQVVMEGAQLLSEEMFNLEEKSLEFAVGDQVKSVTIKFNSEKMENLSNEVTYVIPLVVKVPEGKSVGQHNFFLVTINKQELKRISEGDNIELLKRLPSGIETFPSAALTFDSNTCKDKLNGLKDGKLYTSSWWSKNPKDYLTVSFDYALVEGIYVYGVYRKEIKDIEVLVTIDGINWVSQGKVTNEGNPNLPIKFSSPLSIQGIKLTGMTPYQKGDPFVDIAEISVWKFQKQ